MSSFFFFFDSPDQYCFQIVLQGSYLICFFYLIRWRQRTPSKIPPKKYHLHIISKFFTGSTGSTRRVRLQLPQNKKCQLVRKLKQNLVFLEIFHCILSHNSLFYFCLVLLLNQNPRGNRVRCSHGRKLSRRWDMRLPNTFLYFKGARDHVLVVKDVFLNFLRLNQGMDNLTTLF